MRPIPDAALDIVSRWEGCELTAYRDIVGVLTIGYGSTGPHVTPGLTITKAQARALLKDDLKIAANRVAARLKPDALAGLTENQYAALLSFTFNLGANAKWSIWKVINAGAYDQVPAQLMRFINAGGKRVQGLVNRRADEAKLWNTGDIHEEDLPSSVTREIETPPTPAGKPVSQSKSFVTSCAAAVATAPVAVKAVSDAIEPYADKSPALMQIVGTLALIGGLLAVTALVLQWLKSRNARR